MSLEILRTVKQSNERAREQENEQPWVNPEQGSAPLPPRDGGYDTTAPTPGMATW